MYHLLPIPGLNVLILIRLCFEALIFSIFYFSRESSLKLRAWGEVQKGHFILQNSPILEFHRKKKKVNVKENYKFSQKSNEIFIPLFMRW